MYKISSIWFLHVSSYNKTFKKQQVTQYGLKDMAYTRSGRRRTEIKNVKKQPSIYQATVILFVFPY